jgi:hypothetical protein
MAIPHLQIAEQHRARSFAPLAICCLGLLVTLAAGIVENERSRMSDRRQQVIATDVAKIAQALKTRPAAPDPAFAAARTTLARQTKELAQLRQVLSRRTYLPPNPDVLYKGVVPIAVVDTPIINAAARRILFKVVIAHRELDMTTPFLFRAWSLHCTATAHAGVIGSGANEVKYWNLPCAIEP